MYDYCKYVRAKSILAVYMARAVDGGIPESQSWVTARAQQMSQKAGSWSPEGQPEDMTENRPTSQVT